MSPEAMSKRNIPEAMRNRVGLPAGRIVTVLGTVCVERWEPAAWGPGEKAIPHGDHHLAGLAASQPVARARGCPTAAW